MSEPGFIFRRLVRPSIAAACLLAWVGMGAGAPRITFRKDTAPGLYAPCAGCHRADGPAPFSLVTYAEVKQRATQIAAVTKSRYMPPWKPDEGFGAFIGERRLSEAEIDLIDRWVRT